ncbi:hypothetical protein [Brotaphodocola sp.]|uniref:hypothetical protein n=1 Tax=Brotaphodocola sp. TaxID=3073577 RepID=UPI003D7D6F83
MKKMNLTECEDGTRIGDVDRRLADLLPQRKEVAIMSQKEALEHMIGTTMKIRQGVEAAQIVQTIIPGVETAADDAGERRREMAY